MPKCSRYGWGIHTSAHIYEEIGYSLLLVIENIINITIMKDITSWPLSYSNCSWNFFLVHAPYFILFFLRFFFNFYFYFILFYNTVLVLAYIDMNPPRVYMSSQTWFNIEKAKQRESAEERNSPDSQAIWCYLEVPVIFSMTSFYKMVCSLCFVLWSDRCLFLDYHWNSPKQVNRIKEADW